VSPRGTKLGTAAEPRLIAGKLRQCEAGTRRIFRNAATGKPVDGGGWTPTPENKGKAQRQAGHLNGE